MPYTASWQPGVPSSIVATRLQVAMLSSATAMTATACSTLTGDGTVGVTDIFCSTYSIPTSKERVVPAVPMATSIDKRPL